jgi:hypothetical protein
MLLSRFGKNSDYHHHRFYNRNSIAYAAGTVEDSATATKAKLLPINAIVAT